MNTAPIPQAVLDAANANFDLLPAQDFTAMAVSLGLTPLCLKQGISKSQRSLASDFSKVFGMEPTEADLKAIDRDCQAHKNRAVARGEPVGYEASMHDQIQANGRNL